MKDIYFNGTISSDTDEEIEMKAVFVECEDYYYRMDKESLQEVVVDPYCLIEHKDENVKKVSGLFYVEVYFYCVLDKCWYKHEIIHPDNFNFYRFGRVHTIFHFENLSYDKNIVIEQLIFYNKHSILIEKV